MAAWSVAQVSGDVQLRSGDADWQPLKSDMRIGIGTEIRTGEDGRAVLTRGEESVTISPASRFEPQAAGGGFMTRILQRAGSLMFKVRKQPNRHFEVQTPYLVAAVKGTTFTVSVDAAGGAVHVVEGLVEVGSLDGTDKVLVRPGKTASVSSQRGSKVQIGTTPRKPRQMNGKQSKAPVIPEQIGPAAVDLEKSSNGLFRNPADLGATQSASAASATRRGGDATLGSGTGNAFGKDKSLSGNNGVGLALGLGKSNGNGGGNGNGNGSGNGVANAGGQGNGSENGNGNGNGKGNGNGNGNGKGNN